MTDSPECLLGPDLERLDQLLLECIDDEDAMLLGELDGYLAGLIVSPHPVPQEQWLREIWGGKRDSCFPDDPEKSALLVRLVIARQQEMIAALLLGGFAYAPIFDIDERDDEPLWEIWISGFSRAMGLSGKDWDVLIDSGDEDMQAAFLGLVRYVVVVHERRFDLLDPDDAPPDVMIPYLLETLYRGQKGLPRIIMDDGPPPPVVRPKVGRNEPCPCGSGKKFKKCCGAN